jgi:hypothetical protein
LVIDERGRALAAWSRETTDNKVLTTVSRLSNPAAGEWVTEDRPGYSVNERIDLAIEPRGRALLVWSVPTKIFSTRFE